MFFGVDEKIADQIMKMSTKSDLKQTFSNNKLFEIDESTNQIIQRNGRPLYVFKIDPFMISGASNDDILSNFNSVWEFLNSVELDIENHELMKLLIVQEPIKTQSLESYYAFCDSSHMNPILSEINENLIKKSKINAEKMLRTFYLISDSKHFDEQTSLPNFLQKLTPIEYADFFKKVFSDEITLKKPKKRNKKPSKTLILNDQHLITYAILKYPKLKSNYYMGEIISNITVPSIISFNFSPVETEKVKKMINDSIGNMGVNLPKNPIERIDFEQKMAGYQQLAVELSRSSERVFDLTINIGVFGETEQECVENAKNIASKWRNHDHSIINIVDEGVSGYLPLLPICENSKLIKEFARPIHSRSLSRLWPATTDNFSHEKGLFLGNTQNGKPIILDILNDKSRNIAIYGDTGSGKTFTIALLAMRLASLGFEVLAIMPDRFPKLPYIHQDLNFSLSPKSAKFNPFYIHSTYQIDLDFGNLTEMNAGEYVDDKINQITEFIKILYPKIENEQLKVVHLKQAILQTYERFGLHRDSEKLPKTFPVLTDLADVLLQYPDLEELAYILKENQLSNIFGGQNWNYGEFPITSFSLEHLPTGSIKNTVIDALLRSIWEYVLTKETPIAIIVDEGWQLVGNSTGSILSKNTLSFMRQTSKLIRKRGVPKGETGEGAGMFITATQNLGDFLRSEDAQDVHKLARYKIYLPMSEIDRKAVDSVSARPLSEEHRNVLRDSGNYGSKIYGKGLLSVGDFATFEIRINPTDYEMKMIKNQL